MSTRERTLAILLFGFIVLAGGGAAGYVFAYQPIQERSAASAKLREEIDALTTKRNQWGKDAARLAVTLRRSLPADPADPTGAKREYQEVLTQLLTRAHVPAGYTVTAKDNPDATGTPLLAPKKPAYTKVQCLVEFEKADMWMVHDFLTAYYKLNLLHQITAFKIETATAQGGKAKAPTDRKDLKVTLTTEAIVLDGAENRRTLLPVSSAFAAAGGVASYAAVTLSPEFGRRLTPIPFTQVLSAKNRDYTYLVQHDPFHGILPPPKPFYLPKPSDLTAELGKPLPAAKLAFDGDPGEFGKVKLEATVDRPGWTVKADETAKTVTVTPPAGETGSATVSLVAKPDKGPVGKQSFKASVTEPKAAAAKEDIAATILLIGISTGNDGTALATIRDNANKFKYEVEAAAKDVKVTKYFYVRDQKRVDRDYSTPTELVISDDWSGTSRRFKVVAVCGSGLVLLDLNAGEGKVAPAPKAAAPGKGGGRFPGGFGGRDRMGEGHATPLAVGVGLAAAALPTKPASAEQPVLYRWAAGKSLKALAEVPHEEAKRILQRSAEAGPVGAVAAATGN